MDTLSDAPLAAPLATLPLAPISPRLPLTDPFTPAMAAQAGIGRAVLDRLHREGRVRRLLRGIYLDAAAPMPTPVRARALALVVGSEQVVVGQTAAWLHGVEVLRRDPQAPVPVEVRGRRTPRHRDRSVRYAAHDLSCVEGVRCTTPLRTALDLGRELPPEGALAALDGLLRLGDFPHTALMAEVPRFGGQRGVGQLRELAALADARAAGPTESVLRLRWLRGRLPTPSPGLQVARPGGGRVRLGLGLTVQQFGAVLAGQLADADLLALATQGWRVVALSPDRILRGDPDFLVGHLEREFHAHLLHQVG
jgi:hypothetical protein